MGKLGLNQPKTSAVSGFIIIKALFFTTSPHQPRKGLNVSSGMLAEVTEKHEP